MINVTSRSGAGPAGFIGDLTYGSYADVDGTVGYHTPLGKGSLVAALRNQRSARGLDPPNFDSPHNGFSDANQFVRLTLPSGPNFLNLTVSRSYQTYQIPPDVAAGAARRRSTTTRPKKTCSRRSSSATRSATTARSRSGRRTSARASATSATRPTTSPTAWR